MKPEHAHRKCGECPYFHSRFIDCEVAFARVYDHLNSHEFRPLCDRCKRKHLGSSACDIAYSDDENLRFLRHHLKESEVIWGEAIGEAWTRHQVRLRLEAQIAETARREEVERRPPE